MFKKYVSVFRTYYYQLKIKMKHLNVVPSTMFFIPLRTHFLSEELTSSKGVSFPEHKNINFKNAGNRCKF